MQAEKQQEMQNLSRGFPWLPKYLTEDVNRPVTLSVQDRTLSDSSVVILYYSYLFRNSEIMSAILGKKKIYVHACTHTHTRMYTHNPRYMCMYMPKNIRQ